MSHPPLPRPSTLGPILTFGFATAVGMWILWLVTHHPAINLGPKATGPLLLIALAIGCAASVRRSGVTPWLVGLGSGIVASLVNLLILGMFVVRPPTADGKPAPGFEGITPEALIAIPGFLALGAGVGLLAGFAARPNLAVQARDRQYWLGRFAIVAALSVFPLLILGGAVTSTASGMAVPGWPDSYGANMFLFPISLMSHPRIFLEHTHRLFGAMVGLTTLTLTVYALAVETRRSVKFWAVGAFLLVCLQGYLGGKRVTEISPYIGVLHGVLAQVFFAVMITLATSLTDAYRSISASDATESDRRCKALAAGLLHSTLLQLALGALYRHVGQVKGNLHALWAHAGFSLVVVIMAVLAGFAIKARAGNSAAAQALRKIGVGLVAVVGAQFLLGWGAFIAVMSAGSRGAAPQAHELDTARPVDAVAALVATLHQANGALLLGLATIAVVLTGHFWRSRVTRSGRDQQAPQG